MERFVLSAVYEEKGTRPDFPCTAGLLCVTFFFCRQVYTSRVSVPSKMEQKTQSPLSFILHS